MEPTKLLARAMSANQKLIGELSPADLAKPTPCYGWTVKDLINHMIAVNYHFVSQLTGQSPAADGGEGDLVGNDAAGAFAKAVEASNAAWNAPGAMEKMVQAGPGPMPASQVIGFGIGDQVLHNWDLSKAIGRQPTIDDDLVDYTAGLMQQGLQPSFRGPGKAFGYEVTCPPDASKLDRMVAFSGRQP